MRTVIKFGGTSLATASRIREAIDLVRADPSRQLIVVSAPGKRFPGDVKVTDLLLALFRPRTREKAKRVLRTRFLRLAGELGVSHLERTIVEVLDGCATIATHHRSKRWVAHVASRGEYLCALLFADALGEKFLDASELIRFTRDGVFDPHATTKACAIRLPSQGMCVIPGYYGADSSGIIHTFPRNGSDITGAVIAARSAASLYENATDTDGILAADPRVVPGVRSIPWITRTELSKLAYRGTSVLHGDALFPLAGTVIEVRVFNTRNPDHPGTVVLPDEDRVHTRTGPVVGIAGMTGFTEFTVRKLGVMHDFGFLRDLFGVFADFRTPVMVTPSDVDAQTVVFEARALSRKEEELHAAIQTACRPTSIETTELALLCVVGQTMAHKQGVARRVFTALSDAQVNVRTIDQGASEMSIVIGVAPDDFETAYRALAREFDLFA